MLHILQVHMKPFIVGIAGGSGSGKTTVSEKIVTHFKDKLLYIAHDRYYRDRSDLSMEERSKLNYDHPDSFETDLLIEHLKALQNGETVQMPEYDFTTHTRKPGALTTATPHPLILIEGILILEHEILRNMMNLKIFVDVPADIRILRRLQRDVEERGRTVDSVVEQYLSTVRPMDEKFITPSREFADIVIPQGGYNTRGIQILIDSIEKRLL
ncbi:uridine kinase [soil metagenome]